jgi:hypothetical protein
VIYDLLMSAALIAVLFSPIWFDRLPKEKP